MNCELYIFIGLLVVVLLIYYTLNHMEQPYMLEKFDNYTLEENESHFPYLSDAKLPVNSFPMTENDPLVEGEFPITGRNGISNLGADKIWWHYPTFEVGSYEQITNNLRYVNNPDEGRCTPASMCGTLYKEKKNKSNIIVPLPPVDPECGTRVGYFTTDVNLLPFRTDVTNILY